MDINFVYTPAAGQVFNVSGWNTDIWSLTDGVSVYGELCGHLQDANMHSSFQVGPQHIRPNEGHVIAQGAGSETLEYHDLNFGTQGVGGAQAGDWLPVAGAATRLYLPWNAQAVLYSVSAFLTNHRARETTNPTPGAPVWGGPEMYVKMIVDGNDVNHTRRSFPYTMYPANNPGDAQSMVSRETVLTHHFDLEHMATAGDAAALQGWHDVVLVCLVPKTQGVENLIPQYRTGAGNVALFKARHRLRFGMRGARIIGL